MPTERSGNLKYNSQLYADNDELQRVLNLKTLDLLDMAFTPADNTENQQFLDIGCGTGDFTRDWLLPRCPPCRRLVAVDASEQMLSYARANNAHPKIQYDYLNVGGEVTDFVEKYGRFHRIYSFFCLNWIKDQAKAMINVSRLLAPSGECLLVFPAWSPTRELWKQIAQLDRWRKFSKVFEEFTPKSQDLEDDQARLSYLRDILDTAGLTANTCELLYYKVEYHKATEALVDIQLSVNPVVTSLSPEEKELLRKDVTNQVQKWKSDSDFSARPCTRELFRYATELAHWSTLPSHIKEPTSTPGGYLCSLEDPLSEDGAGNGVATGWHPLWWPPGNRHYEPLCLRMSTSEDQMQAIPVLCVHNYVQNHSLYIAQSYT
ncbi:hypothetical protein MTO96_032704 [Rhipicephalus appendiculatus]